MCGKLCQNRPFHGASSVILTFNELPPPPGSGSKLPAPSLDNWSFLRCLLSFTSLLIASCLDEQPRLCWPLAFSIIVHTRRTKLALRFMICQNNAYQRSSSSPIIIVMTDQTPHCVTIFKHINLSMKAFHRFPQLLQRVHPLRFFEHPAAPNGTYRHINYNSVANSQINKLMLTLF